MTLPNRVSAMAPWLILLFAFVAGALPPLHEMDLAQHLATGEWIVRHRAFPFTEPFAWTRSGQPYFAYSWLPQVLYFTLLRALGPVALHILTGAIGALAFVAATWAARQFAWRRSTCLAVGVLHVALLWGVANTLRPQQLLFIALPLAWGLAARIRATGLTGMRVIALISVGAFASNSHIFFPLTIAPFVFFLLTTADARRWIPAAAAMIGGWLINPYAFAMPALFALNFGHNVLLERPPAIAEFVPGFEYARHRPGVAVAVLALLIAPWFSMTTPRMRERATSAAFWSVGLLLFAYAGRLVLAWWTLALPMVGAAVQRAGEHTVNREREPRRAACFVLAAALVLIGAAPPVSTYFWSFEGDTAHRMLPRAGEDATLWLPSWLLCNTKPGAAGRIYAEFNYGSELNWRLPGYSPSIDGRTIFPDSDAIEYSFQPHGRRRTHATTWSNADLVLVNHSFWLALVVSQQPDWVLLAQSRTSSRYGTAGLWAKRTWWQRWGSPAQLPAVDVRIADPRATCAVTGTFPKS